MRRGDESDIPEVAQAAKTARSQVFDPLKDAAIKVGLLPKDVEVSTAPSYFSRMWNRNKLIAQEGQFKGIVADYYGGVIGREYQKAATAFNARMGELTDDAAKAELTRAFYDRWEITNLGKGVDPAASIKPDFGDQARSSQRMSSTPSPDAPNPASAEFMAVGTRGPMKDRTFYIPDELIEDFLDHDAEEVMKRYVRVMGADVEMTHKFGSVDMKEQIDAIRAGYDQLRAGAADEAARRALDKQERSDVGDLTSLRDIYRGTRDKSMSFRGRDLLQNPPKRPALPVHSEAGRADPRKPARRGPTRHGARAHAVHADDPQPDNQPRRDQTFRRASATRWQRHRAGARAAACHHYRPARPIFRSRSRRVIPRADDERGLRLERHPHLD